MFPGGPTLGRSAMRQRSFIALTAAVAFLLIGSVAVDAYDSSHSDQIASGIKAGGVDIGGLKTAAARTKLRHDLTASMSRPIDAVYHGKSFRLDASQTRIKID